MAAGTPVTLRLTIDNPVPGLAYSLCDKANQPAGAKRGGDGPLSFDVPVRLAPGPRFLGDFVRSEGPHRRFVYISLGTMAGDATSSIGGGRMKIDIQDIPEPLLEAALEGRIVEVELAGRGKTGGPAYATAVRQAWRLV